MNSELRISVKLGELVEIKLRTGEMVRGCVAEKVNNGFRLSDAYITLQNPESPEKQDEWAPAIVLVEIPYDNIAALHDVSMVS